jgi:NAD(P) transhydrogenase subunit alpha
MMTDLTPEKDGQLVHNMEDDVIRSSTVTFEGEITFPPPPLKVQAIASKAAPKQPEKTPEEKAVEAAAAIAKAGRQQTQLLVIGAALMALIGLYAPTAFMQHFIVFVLAVFVGFQVIWGVAHSLHTPLMAVTNAISGIIIVGALLQVDSSIPIVSILAGISVLIATINIVGGFMVTRRMLQMFKKS